MKKLKTHLILPQKCPDCEQSYPVHKYTLTELNDKVLKAGRPDLVIAGPHPLANEDGIVVYRLPCVTPKCVAKRERSIQELSVSNAIAMEVELARRLQEAGIASLPFSFSNFQVDWPSKGYHRQALKKAHDSVQSFVGQQCGLLLTGPYGSGKTHLAIAALRKWLEGDGQSGFHLACLEAWDGIKASWHIPGSVFRYRGIDATETWMLERCQAAQMLVIDDMDKVEISVGWLGWLLPIVNYRAERRLSTLFTVNHRVEEMQTFLCQKAESSDKGYALWDRIVGLVPQELCIQLPADLPSYRRH